MTDALPNQCPQWGPQTRIATQALVVGDVILGDRCSIWPFATLRGDVNRIHVGDATNLQEQVVVHVSRNADVDIGSYVTIGHGAIVHGCHIESHCLIGMHATILDGATIGHHCIIGAHALVVQHQNIPPYSLVLGVPGKVVRPLTEKDIQLIEDSAQEYLDALSHWCF